MRKTIGFYACDDILRLPLIFQFMFFTSTERFAYKHIFTQTFHRPISRMVLLGFTERHISFRTVSSPSIYILTIVTKPRIYSSGTKSPDSDMSESSDCDESSTITTSEVAGPERASRDSSSACHIAIERANEAREPSATAIRYRISEAMPWAMVGDRRGRSDRAGKAAERGREGREGIGTTLVVVGRRLTGFLFRTAAKR